MKRCKLISKFCIETKQFGVIFVCEKCKENHFIHPEYRVNDRFTQYLPTIVRKQCECDKLGLNNHGHLSYSTNVEYVGKQ